MKKILTRNPDDGLGKRLADLLQALVEHDDLHPSVMNVLNHYGATDELKEELRELLRTNLPRETIH